MSFLRFLMLLALVVWIGGIIFFALVEAPTLFTVLPNTRLAGDVVSPSLSKLHWMGLVCGSVFLISSLFYNQVRSAQLKPLAASHVLIALMLLLTAVSQFRITPKMTNLRAEMQAVDRLPGDNSRLEFDRLHAWSTRLESGVLLLGIGVVALTARKEAAGS
jgi:uncharacterized protein DUF4149